ncbi:hypothetical protein [Massilia aquatica]|uniref:Uncharacterized protein n=1 Tax=Massilia aquatica TaxID=2609000 RepID=A0ABX0MCF5_9BURK|nr:hypothetical protein [Massilia aquatica]NHZ44864.1 hypothetical protein [Massilia aquatica]
MKGKRGKNLPIPRSAADHAEATRIWLYTSPAEFILHGCMLPVFPLALAEFKAFSKDAWPLENYSITGAMSEDRRYGAVSFVPDESCVSAEGVFDFAAGGRYWNGRGVTYVYSLADRVLVNSTYTR